MRALVCGGRDFSDYLLFAQTIREIEARRGKIGTIIHGGARGADWFAHLFCDSPKGARREERFPADWKTHGRAAGPIRNQRMIDEGKPDLVIAFPGGRGTADMVRRARRANIEVIEVSPLSEKE